MNSLSSVFVAVLVALCNLVASAPLADFPMLRGTGSGSGMPVDSSSGSGLGTGAIVGIIVACVAVVGIAGGVCYYRKGQSSGDGYQAM